MGNPPKSSLSTDRSQGSLLWTGAGKLPEKGW
jgi:hypothetical protein